MKISLAILFCLTVGLLLIPQPQNNATVQTENSSFPDLSAILNNADNPRFQKVLSQILSRLKQRNGAMDYILLGDFLLCYGFCEESCVIYTLAMQQDRAPYDAYIGYAVSIDLLGYPEQAITAYAAANTHTSENYQRDENTQRQGELLLRIGKTEEAKQKLLSIDYPPALLRLCRIYVAEDNWEQASAAFHRLHAIDGDQNSLEIYQLNALAQRHFNKEFSGLNPTRQRELNYSENTPLKVRNALAEHMFDIHINDLYQDEIAQLPLNNNGADAPFTNDDIYAASFETELVADGKRIFQNNNCIVCHGADASGSTGPNLRDEFWIMSPISGLGIFHSISKGRNKNTMPAYKSLLEPSQILQVSAYLLNLHRTTLRQEDGSTEAGKAPQGKRQRLNRP